MIEITVKQLQELKACEAGINWFISQKKRSLKLVISALLEDSHFSYAKWLLSHLLTNEQNVMWSINSAESVLNLFEDKYPKDDGPRKAIQAAKDFLAGKTTSYAAHAADATYAADAAYAARAADAAHAAYAAAYAAYAAHAAYAAYAADTVHAAAYAAHAAAYAAHAADAAYAADTVHAAAYAADAADAAYAAHAAHAADAADAKKQKEIEVCNFALKILGERE